MRIVIAVLLGVACACSGPSPSERAEPDPEPRAHDEAVAGDDMPADAEALLSALRAARARELDEPGAVDELMALAQHAADSGLLVGLEMNRVDGALHEPPHSGACTPEVNVCTDAPASARWYSVGRRARSLGIVPTLVVEPGADGRVARVRASFPR